MLRFIAVVASILLVGCNTPNNLSITADNAIKSRTDTRSVGKMDGNGSLTAAYNGVAPTQAMMDGDGVWMNTPGQGGWLIFDPSTGRVSLWSPKDTIITGLKITPNPNPGEASFEAESIKSNITEVAKVYAAQFEAGVSATQGMSKAEAEARLGAMQVLGQITPEIVDVLIKALYPVAAITAK